MEIYRDIFESPIGTFKLTCTDTGLSGLLFDPDLKDFVQNSHPIIDETKKQLDHYFNHQAEEFDIKLDLSGTEFQRKVWKEVYKIKYGVTATYLDIARSVGNVKAVRAVGLANGKNPVPLIVPCHRIIGSNNKLIGYGGGLWRKEWLLKHEGALLI
jgi:methylated-DNA-[protein]-cysteine S-methyltransferase